MDVGKAQRKNWSCPHHKGVWRREIVPDILNLDSSWR